MHHSILRASPTVHVGFQLLPDTKPGENGVEEVFGGDFAGDHAQRLQSGAQINAHEVAGYPVFNGANGVVDVSLCFFQGIPVTTGRHKKPGGVDVAIGQHGGLHTMLERVDAGTPGGGDVQVDGGCTTFLLRGCQ